MIDRGFIKWQPFNSVIPSKMILNNLTKEVITKPTLFPEEEQTLNDKIIDAFYSKDKILIYFYENKELKVLNTYISKINPSTNTLELGNYKIISFRQVYSLETK